MEVQALKRGCPEEEVIPRRTRESPAEEQRKAREVAEAVAALEKEIEEGMDKPPPDIYALDAADFRESWCSLWSEHFGDFEDSTKIPAMRFTDHPEPPANASIFGTVQIFSVKVAKLGGGLQWPLQVYGTVALRDAVDCNRNIIFHRKRDNCQTLTREDQNLALTGPTRAVVLMRPLTFEVELMVKGVTESEDKGLSYLAVFLLQQIPEQSPPKSSLFTREYKSMLSTLEFTHAYIPYSLEATISVRIVGGSWNGYRGQFLARTDSVNQEVLLLDSGNNEVPANHDRKIELTREVVC